MRRSLSYLVVVLLLILAGTSPALFATPAQGQRFLGFEVGEERRYVLGPPESLLRGETAMWSIQLDEIYTGEDGAPAGEFSLRHEWQAPQSRTEVPLRTIMRVNSKGTVRVNAYGFPTKIHHETVRHLAGLGNEAYTIEYELKDDNRAYEKSTTREGEDWKQHVAIRRHDGVDRNAPAGLYAFLPNAPGCMDRRVFTYEGQSGVNPQPGATGSPGQVLTPRSTLKVVDNADCEESLFAHPGLLSLAMPALWEAQGEREYLFFTPIGPVGEPHTGAAVGIPGLGQPGQPGGPPMGPGGRPVGVMGAPSSMGRLQGAPLSYSTYHEIETLKFIERVSIRIGSRTREAWLIEMSNDFGPIYVDDDGGVLRIDLPPLAGGGERYLRMLWPSEF